MRPREVDRRDDRNHRHGSDHHEASQGACASTTVLVPPGNQFCCGARLEVPLGTVRWLIARRGRVVGRLIARRGRVVGRLIARRGRVVGRLIPRWWRGPFSKRRLACIARQPASARRNRRRMRVGRHRHRGRSVALIALGRGGELARDAPPRVRPALEFGARIHRGGNTEPGPRAAHRSARTESPRRSFAQNSYAPLRPAGVRSRNLTHPGPGVHLPVQLDPAQTRHLLRHASGAHRGHHATGSISMEAETSACRRFVYLYCAVDHAAPCRPDASRSTRITSQAIYPVRSVHYLDRGDVHVHGDSQTQRDPPPGTRLHALPRGRTRRSGVPQRECTKGAAVPDPGMRKATEAHTASHLARPPSHRRSRMNPNTPALSGQSAHAVARAATRLTRVDTFRAPAVDPDRSACPRV